MRQIAQQAASLTFTLLAIAVVGTAAATSPQKKKASAAHDASDALRVEDYALYDPARYPVPASPAGDHSNHPIPPAHLPLKPIQPPVLAKPAAPSWVTQGAWLRPALAQWAKRAGWGIRWLDATGKPTDTDRHLDAPLHFTGDFPDAVRQCIELYAKAGDHLAYDAYPTSKIIVITETN